MKMKKSGVLVLVVTIVILVGLVIAGAQALVGEGPWSAKGRCQDEFASRSYKLKEDYDFWEKLRECGRKGLLPEGVNEMYYP